MSDFLNYGAEVAGGQRPWTLALSLLLLWFIVYGFRPSTRWKLRHLPGPSPVWMVGNLLPIVKNGIWRTYYKWAQQYGKIFKIQFGREAVVVISDPEVGRLMNLRNLMRPQLKQPIDLVKDETQVYEKATLFASQDREYHRSLKNAWLPFFYGGSLDGYACEMTACADILTARLDAAAKEGKPANIWRMLGEMTMDVVGTCAFGVQFRTQEVGQPGTEEAQALVQAAQAIFQTTQVTSIYFAIASLLPFLTPLMSLLATHLPDPGMRKIRKDRKLVLDISLQLLQEARANQQLQEKLEQADAHKGVGMGVAAAQVSATSSFDDEVKAARKVRKGGFLQLLVNARHKDGRPFTDPEIVRQAFTFILAGYETTAATLGFCVYNLSTNPDKLAKLLKVSYRGLLK